MREAIASKMVQFYHIHSELNCADLLSKHWGHSNVYPNLLKPLLFHEGDTLDLISDEEPEAVVDAKASS